MLTTASVGVSCWPTMSFPKPVSKSSHDGSRNRETCRWTVQGEAAEVRRSDERGTVLAILREADAPMSPAELALLADSRGGAIRKLLHLMSKAGEVRKVGTGRYIHPDRTDLAGNGQPSGNAGNGGNTLLHP